MRGGGVDPSRNGDTAPSGLPRTPWSRWPRDGDGEMNGDGNGSGGRDYGWRGGDGDIFGILASWWS